MERKNRHSWEPIKGSTKLKHAECMYCQLQKWWDKGFGKLIYMDKYGKIHYRTPSCTHITPHHNKKIPEFYY